MTEVPGFELQDLDGGPHSLPAQRPTLLCFVKEDCATCNLAAPLIQAMHYSLW